MGYIEWGNIDQKITQISQSSKFKAKAMDVYLTGGSTAKPEEAAKAFQHCLEQAIIEKGYYPSSLFTGYSITSPKQISDTKVRIGLVAHGRHVDSLYPEGYPAGYDNLGELLDRGYSAKNRVFKKLDDGSYIYSRQFRTGERYFDRAIDSFMGTYASKYFVTNIDVLN